MFNSIKHNLIHSNLWAIYAHLKENIMKATSLLLQLVQSPRLLTTMPSVLLAAIFMSSTALANDDIRTALTSGKPTVDFDLRYEQVSQDNAVQDAQAFTLRTRLGYESGTYEGFSFKIEMEDNRIVLGEGDYTVGPAGYNPGIYSVIADPEFTELDQGYVQYKNDSLTVKIGRQVIALDGQRFVGHVGWRHDRQTFDAATVIYAPNDKFKAQYSYLTQRNRIFGEFADINAKDHLLNASYKTDHGTLVAYAYLLEADNSVDNGLDTYGASFTGAKSLDTNKIAYRFEYATQTSKAGVAEYDTNYLFGELGLTFSGTLNGLTAKVGYEVLGSDNGEFGFATPLATLHKFNGWSDQFLGTPPQGLQDTIFTLTGPIAGGKWLVAYHNFEADQASNSVDDLGSEINLQYTTKIFKHYTLGLKYADYSGAGARVDADKLWVWLSTKF
jgi:hypothetical protein